jgi:hypothetical protein
VEERYTANKPKEKITELVIFRLYAVYTAVAINIGHKTIKIKTPTPCVSELAIFSAYG